MLFKSDGSSKSRSLGQRIKSPTLPPSGFLLVLLVVLLSTASLFKTDSSLLDLYKSKLSVVEENVNASLSSYHEEENETQDETLNLCTLKDFIDITATEYIENPPADIPAIKTDWRTYRLNESHCALRENYLTNEENLKLVQANFSKGNFQLLPKRALNGECQLPKSHNNHHPRSPFPDNSIVLFIGNSHLNQLVTSLLCRYDDIKLTRRGCDDQCDFDTLNMTKCWGDAGKDPERHSHFIHAVFPNGAELYFVYNSPIFYIGGAGSLVQNMMKVFDWKDLNRLTHIVLHQFNGLFWASHYYLPVCPDMAWVSEETKKTDYHLSKMGYRTFPSAIDIILGLENAGFSGTVLVSERALDAIKACGWTNWTANVLCLDHMKRFDMDKGTAFDCALDQFGHQCQPGPVDSVADWLSLLFFLE